MKKRKISFNSRVTVRCARSAEWNDIKIYKTLIGIRTLKAYGSTGNI